MDAERLKQLCIEINYALSVNPEKDKRYIAFLVKHKLPNSGPTPELLSKLNKEQKEELLSIVITNNVKKI